METTSVKDEIYSFEIARRVVGRAALHLGIDSMTEQALDVMTDVLLQYLTRTGQALSHLVESSRRTSAHVNVLDAFQACQLVTSPAVERVHLQEPEEDELISTTQSSSEHSNSSSSNNNNKTSMNGVNNTMNGIGSSTNPGNGSTQSSFDSSSHSMTGWKGLAAFAFGPKWLEEKDEEDLLDQSMMTSNNTDETAAEDRELLSSGAGGKVFPSSLADNEIEDGNTIARTRNRRRGGWDAPYPDFVPTFPRASATCANPHALPAKLPRKSASGAGSAAYRKVDIDMEEAAEEENEAMIELEGMPDDAFTPQPSISLSWGSINGNKKRKLDRGNATNDDNDLPPTKRIKIEESEMATSFTAKKTNVFVQNGHRIDNKDNAEDDSDSILDDYLYVPSFYPRPPCMKTMSAERRIVIDDQQQRLLQQRQQQQHEQQISANDGSPASLADLNSSQGVRSSLARTNQNYYWGSGWDQASKLAVPMGRRTNANGSGNTNVSGGATSTAEVPIIPVNRASGSRVSRILEGSMDAAAM